MKPVYTPPRPFVAKRIQFVGTCAQAPYVPADPQPARRYWQPLPKPLVVGGALGAFMGRVVSRLGGYR